VLQGDANGDGDADFAISFNGKPTLAATDFLLGRDGDQPALPPSPGGLYAWPAMGDTIMTADIPQVSMREGRMLPALGQGTWMMGERASEASREIESLRRGIELGLTLIDTAEMYADGGAERIVARAIEGRRDSIYLVTKVYPWNASRQGTIDACRRSLDRLQTDRIDLYLLHWRGEHPLANTVEAFERLKADGLIGEWGVSNFDTEDMEELVSVPSGANVAVNQILYNLHRRGPEYELIPWCRARTIPIMAYSPIEQGALAAQPALIRIAKAYQATPAQVALAFTMRRGNVIAIPKTSNVHRVEENREAASLHVTDEDWAALDAIFPPAQRKTPLEMI
jgi:diketogulonate reductase-like aldo/keto reductase